MHVIFHLPSADDFNDDLVKSIKETFKSKPITVVIEAVEDGTYLNKDVEIEQ